MIKRQDRKVNRSKRHRRVRVHVVGTPERPRLAVFRSLNHLYAQLIDDTASRTVAASSTIELKAKGNGLTQAIEVGKAIATKAKIMGFGHRVYKVKDPRATVLQELAENVFAETSRPKLYEIAVELERVAAGILGPKGIYPNVDFYSGIVYQALGIPRDLFTPIFAIARVAGWLAHWLEQLKNNRIYRPEQEYIGKRNAEYVPLAKRP